MFQASSLILYLTELADLTITDAYGSSAGETFNTLQANNGRVLGFSLSGAVIPGSGTLVFLDFHFWRFRHY